VLPNLRAYSPGSLSKPQASPSYEVQPSGSPGRRWKENESGCMEDTVDDQASVKRRNVYGRQLVAV